MDTLALHLGDQKYSELSDYQKLIGFVFMAFLKPDICIPSICRQVISTLESGPYIDFEAINKQDTELWWHSCKHVKCLNMHAGADMISKAEGLAKAIKAYGRNKDKDFYAGELLTSLCMGIGLNSYSITTAGLEVVFSHAIDVLSTLPHKESSDVKKDNTTTKKKPLPANLSETPKTQPGKATPEDLDKLSKDKAMKYSDGNCSFKFTDGGATFLKRVKTIPPRRKGCKIKKKQAYQNAKGKDKGGKGKGKPEGKSSNWTYYGYDPNYPPQDPTNPQPPQDAQPEVKTENKATANMANQGMSDEGRKR